MKQRGKTPVWVIYDAQCPICRRFADWGRGSSDPQVRFCPASEAPARFPGLNPDALAQAVHLVQADGQVYKGAGAIFRLLERRRRLWAIPGWFYRRVPGVAPAAEAVYGWVARRRPRACACGRPSVSEGRPAIDEKVVRSCADDSH